MSILREALGHRRHSGRQTMTELVRMTLTRAPHLAPLKRSVNQTPTDTKGTSTASAHPEHSAPQEAGLAHHVAGARRSHRRLHSLSPAGGDTSPPTRRPGPAHGGVRGPKHTCRNGSRTGSHAASRGNEPIAEELKGPGR